MSGTLHLINYKKKEKINDIDIYGYPGVGKTIFLASLHRFYLNDNNIGEIGSPSEKLKSIIELIQKKIKPEGSKKDDENLTFKIDDTRFKITAKQGEIYNNYFLTDEDGLDIDEGLLEKYFDSDHIFVVAINPFVENTEILEQSIIEISKLIVNISGYDHSIPQAIEKAADLLQVRGLKINKSGDNKGEPYQDGVFDGLQTVEDIENVIGTGGNDTIIGDSLVNTLDGGAGDDEIIYDSDDTSINGGEGFDTIILEGTENIDFDSITTSISNIESIDMSNSESNSLTHLTLDDVINMTDDDNTTLRIKGDDVGDSVDVLASDGWVNTEPDIIEDVTYTVWTNSNDLSSEYKLLIEEDINTVI